MWRSEDGLHLSIPLFIPLHMTQLFCLYLLHLTTRSGFSRSHSNSRSPLQGVYYTDKHWQPLTSRFYTPCENHSSFLQLDGRKSPVKTGMLTDSAQARHGPASPSRPPGNEPCREEPGSGGSPRAELHPGLSSSRCRCSRGGTAGQVTQTARARHRRPGAAIPAGRGAPGRAAGATLRARLRAPVPPAAAGRRLLPGAVPPSLVPVTPSPGWGLPRAPTRRWRIWE